MQIYILSVHGDSTMNSLLNNLCVILKNSYEYGDKHAYTHFVDLFWGVTVTAMASFELRTYFV